MVLRAVNPSFLLTNAIKSLKGFAIPDRQGKQPKFSRRIAEKSQEESVMENPNNNAETTDVENGGASQEIDKHETVETEGVGTDAGADNQSDGDDEFTDSDAEAGGDGDKQTDKKPADEKPADKNQPFKNAENAEHARLRREREQKEAIEKAKREAIIEHYVGRQNPFTNEVMKDKNDVQEYLTMQEIDKSGKDPVADYASYVKQKAREQEKTEAERKTRDEYITNDRKDFEVKYPNVKLSTVIEDGMFKRFANGKVGKIPMADIYADYLAFEQEYEKRAVSKSAQILANSKTSTGGLTNSTPPAQKSISDMSSQQFKDLRDKIGV
jgi:hypothetical protein